MTKDKMIKALSEFMAEKGVETMDLKTYKSFGNEVPVKDYLLKRYWGSWNRVLGVVKKKISCLSSTSTCTKSGEKGS